MRAASLRSRPTDHPPAPPAAAAGAAGATATRRAAWRLGGAALAALAAARLGGGARAQDATPGAAGSKEGRYAVARSRRLKPGASHDEINAAVREGFVPILQEIPDFVEYYIVTNAATRERTSVGIFADKAGADASTERAAEFLRERGLVDRYEEDATPVILEGAIAVFAAAGG
jgi:hypothetical protein